MRISIESNDKPPEKKNGRPKGSKDKERRKARLPCSPGTDSQLRKPRSPRLPGAGKAPTRAQRAIIAVAHKERRSRTDEAELNTIARLAAEAREAEQGRLRDAERVYAARKESARLAIDKVRADDAARLAKATELRQAWRKDDLAAISIDESTAL